MPWTRHGHWYGLHAPTPPAPTHVTACGGPARCTDCAREAQRAALDDGPRHARAAGLATSRQLTHIHALLNHHGVTRRGMQLAVCNALTNRTHANLLASTRELTHREADGIIDDLRGADAAELTATIVHAAEKALARAGAGATPVHTADAPERAIQRCADCGAVLIDRVTPRDHRGADAVPADWWHPTGARVAHATTGETTTIYLINRALRDDEHPCTHPPPPQCHQ